ncbi:MAG: signal recognition particle-docking protein FtsY [Planctomycetes bacterium]|nr:signal recognition particle-docking protein FtsY [Planctomycetota bacterium]
MFERLRAGLRKTREKLAAGLNAILSIGRDLDDALLDELEELLYTADLGATGTEIIEKARTAYRQRALKTSDQVYDFLKQEVRERLGARAEVRLAEKAPTVILVVGVNGSGKTTSIAKLARFFARRGQKVVIGAADTFRAAAVEQLAIWAERVGASLVKGKAQGDPAAVAFDAAETALAEGADVLLVDTAGRLHTHETLMRELTKISSVLGKRIAGAPHEVILVLDATTGQNALVQAEKFKAAVPVSALFLAKLDGSAKGGAAVAIRDRVGLPVKFVGVGEKADDIEEFDPQAFAESLFAG